MAALEARWMGAMDMPQEGVAPPCPNDPAHTPVEVAFYDEDERVTHWVCKQQLAYGGPCYAEWVTEDK